MSLCVTNVRFADARATLRGTRFTFYRYAQMQSLRIAHPSVAGVRFEVFGHPGSRVRSAANSLSFCSGIDPLWSEIMANSRLLITLASAAVLAAGCARPTLRR